MISSDLMRILPHSPSPSPSPHISPGKAIAGTTDTPSELTPTPSPKEEDIRFILDEIRNYLSPNLSGEWEGGCVDVWEGGCVGGWMCGRVDVARVDVWEDECVGGWMCGCVNEGISG